MIFLQNIIKPLFGWFDAATRWP